MQVTQLKSEIEIGVTSIFLSLREINYSKEIIISEIQLNKSLGEKNYKIGAYFPINHLELCGSLIKIQ